MEFGVHLPQWGPAATRDGVLALVQTVERVGLDSVWVADHIVYPLDGLERYPYGQVPSFRPEDGLLEPLTALSVVAGATNRIRLGTSALIVPMRNPLVTAKTVSTLDVLSGGRTVLAVGAGWWVEEFEALGATFDRRYAQLDEQIDIFLQIWTEGRLESHGEFYSFGELVCEPRPLQPGGPEIWIAGNGPLAIRRAARYGSGWHSFHAPPEDVFAGIEAIAQEARKIGRDPSEVRASTVIGLSQDQEKITDRVLSYAEVGVSFILLSLRAGTIDERCEAVERFAANALPMIDHELRAVDGLITPNSSSSEA